MTTKYCKTCHETKPLAEMAKNKTSTGGYRNLCKACMNILQDAQRRERKERDAAKAKAEAEAKQQTPPSVAAPRTFNYMGSIYRPEPGHYRNNGNRHIPSRGWV